MASARRNLATIPVVRDDAIVDDAELDIGGRGVGMRVVVGGFAMGGPAGVGNAEVARQLLVEVKGLLAHLLAENGDLERAQGKRKVSTRVQPG